MGELVKFFNTVQLKSEKTDHSLVGPDREDAMITEQRFDDWYDGHQERSRQRCLVVQHLH